MCVCVTEGCVKDLTKKYAGQWLSLSSTRRLQLNERWWNDTLQPYAVTDSAAEHSENQHIRGTFCRRDLCFSPGGLEILHYPQF